MSATTENMGPGCSHTQPRPPPSDPAAQSLPPSSTQRPKPYLPTNPQCPHLPRGPHCVSRVRFRFPLVSLGPRLPSPSASGYIYIFLFSETESPCVISCPYLGTNLGSRFPRAPTRSNPTSVGLAFIIPCPHIPVSSVKVEGELEDRDQEILRQRCQPHPLISPSSANFFFLPGSL